MEPIECFGYTAEIFTGTPETLELTEKLVSVKQLRSESNSGVWVDRFDVQLLLEDPTVLWSTHSVGQWFSSEPPEMEVSLDHERYQDLLSSSFFPTAYSTGSDFMVLAGPMKGLRSGVTPTAEEFSQNPRALAEKCSSTEATSSQTIEDDRCSRELPVSKKRRVFIPDRKGISAEDLSTFMREVRERQKTSDLATREFWPSCLSTHLSIERTAALVNLMGGDAGKQLVDFISDLTDDDRLALGFVHRWHSLHPYYRLMLRSNYRHAEHHRLPSSLHQLFEKPIFEESAADVRSAGAPRWEKPNEVSEEGSRICHELGLELLRRRRKDLVKRALAMLRDASSGEWRILEFQESEWDFLKHIVLDVLLQVDAQESLPPLPSDLHPKTQQALKLLEI